MNAAAEEGLSYWSILAMDVAKMFETHD